MMNHALQKTLRRLNEHELSKVYQQVFNTDPGRLVLEDLRNRGFIFVPTETDRDEGKRSLILHIETMTNPEPPEEIPGTGEPQ